MSGMRGGHRRLALVSATALVASLLPAGLAGAAPPPGGTYWDDDGNTHEGMIEATKQFASSEKIPSDQFEFQMLHGIATAMHHELARQGYRFRVYVPYGTHWYPYFMRRLAERPANVAFLLRGLFRR